LAYIKSNGSGNVGKKIRLSSIPLVAAFAFSLLVPASRSVFIAADGGSPSSGSTEDSGYGLQDPPSGVGSIGTENAGILQTPQDLFYTSYHVMKGDTIGEIADRSGLAQDTILSFNGIKNSRLLQIGQYLKLPNQDGLLYSWKESDTVEKVAERYEIDPASIHTINYRIVDEPSAGDKLFLPEAKLARTDLQEINGDLLAWPIRGYISSKYGYRTSPFTGARQFHSGLDIAAPYGTPIRTAMAGRVSATGYDVNSGNYIIIAHHSGYRTFYGHLDVIRVKAGEYVKDGQKIGDVGSTGLSTGSHLHFTVFKYGVTVNPRNLLK